jgi:hypothetical protein
LLFIGLLLYRKKEEDRNWHVNLWAMDKRV